MVLMSKTVKQVALLEQIVSEEASEKKQAKNRPRRRLPVAKDAEYIVCPLNLAAVALSVPLRGLRAPWHHRNAQKRIHQGASLLPFRKGIKIAVIKRSDPWTT